MCDCDLEVLVVVVGDGVGDGVVEGEVVVVEAYTAGGGDIG